MTDILDRKWHPARDVFASKLGDERVLLHLHSGIYFGTDALGTFIWERLRDTPLRSLCATIADRYDVPGSAVEKDVRSFIEELGEHRLIEEVR